jgi:membrane associated rhomboid family serine protease
VIPIRDDNPAGRTPVVTYSIMALCGLVYVIQLGSGERGFQSVFYSFGLIPAVLTNKAVLPPELSLVPPYLTVVTSMFLHGGFLHLAGNMLYLWIFSDNVEDRLGRGSFAVFYLLCGVGAALAQILPDPGSRIPMVGASGAISGVLGAYLILFPHARVLVALPLGPLIHMLRMRAVSVLGLWFLLQLVSSLMASPGQGGVAFRAHLGGFVTGIMLLPLFSSRADRG